MISNWMAVVMVRQYIELYLPLPKSEWPPYMLKQRLYARWAALELVNRLNSMEEDTIPTFEHFMDQLQDALDDEPDEVYEIALGALRDIMNYI